MPASDYVKLEERLVLAAWGCHMLGFDEGPPHKGPANARMLDALREVQEGFEPQGGSHIVRTLLARGRCRVPAADLERYDENIRGHLHYFNQKRGAPLTLRYFQHVSLLLSELFLDRLFNHDKLLRADLNEFVAGRNSRRAALDPRDAPFDARDLTKLAFWMATGSGKTILMHFHYRQFLHYCKKPLDNILLVTPDENLSQQHLEEMAAAGIPCERFTLSESGFEAVRRNTVRVIEITKFVEEKRGGGVSVPVEAFEGYNLIFVDEGHRGAGSEARKWVGYRSKLAETGFTFEYSATFGQAMTAGRDDAMTREYGKAILFDYSYKYFYGDGFGKDFEVLNLKQETDEAQTRTLLLGNLLAFHEQKRVFQTKSMALLRYHLADPLWIFVGSTVNKSKDNKQAKDSDVLTVLKFLDALLRNQGGWVQKAIKRILDGKSGIEDEGRDIFESRFAQLRAWSSDAERIWQDVLERVFHSASGGRLHVGDVKGKAGELGLKVSGAEHYFGLVYIGDTSSFKSLIQQQCPDVELQEDHIGESLFDNIKRPQSPINLLIGAKKFMQGWSSWRVSNMGLLNIGRSEGSEIIQLFGRGVRLLGRDRSLKRTAALSGSHPKGIELLERLNIFAIRANYMVQFRDYLEREGIEPLGSVELPLKIKRNDEFLRKGLIIPRLPEESKFEDKDRFVLELDPATRVVLDLSTRVERIGSAAGKFHSSSYVGGEQHWVRPDQLRWLDFERIYLDIVEFKEAQGFRNLVVKPEHARQILGNDPPLYGLICDAAWLKPRRGEHVAQLQSALTAVVQKYVEKFYRQRQQRWDSKQMVYAPLLKDDDNFRDYVVKVPRSDPALVMTIEEITREGKRIYKEFSQQLRNVHFDRHLYQPLLAQKDGRVKTAPPGLTDSEQRFVEDLKNYCLSKPAALEGKELFLLRNLSRGKGVGFFENSGFYPDFVLWIIQGKKQRLIFVEPHGMRMEIHPTINPKVNLHQRLQAEAATGLRRAKLKNVEVDSYIISFTPFEDLCQIYGPEDWDRAKFAEAHILFFGSLGDTGAIEAIVG